MFADSQRVTWQLLHCFWFVNIHYYQYWTVNRSRAFFELLSSTIVAVSLDELSHDKTKQIKIEVNFMFNNFIYFLYLDLREYLAKCVYLIHLALLRYILFEHCITVFVLGLVQNLN